MFRLSKVIGIRLDDELAEEFNEFFRESSDLDKREWFTSVVRGLLDNDPISGSHRTFADGYRVAKRKYRVFTECDSCGRRGVLPGGSLREAIKLPPGVSFTCSRCRGF